MPKQTTAPSLEDREVFGGNRLIELSHKEAEDHDPLGGEEAKSELEGRKVVLLVQPAVLELNFRASCRVGFSITNDRRRYQLPI